MIVLPLFIIASIGITKLINIWREKNGMEKIKMNSKPVEMSFASTGRSMKFYQDFYAVSIVSYIYYHKN